MNRSADAAIAADFDPPPSSPFARRLCRAVSAGLFLCALLIVVSGFRGRTDSAGRLMAMVGIDDAALVEVATFDEGYCDHGWPVVFLRRSVPQARIGLWNLGEHVEEFNVAALVVDLLVFAAAAWLAARLAVRLFASASSAGEPRQVSLTAVLVAGLIVAAVVLWWRDAGDREARLLDAHRFFAASRGRIRPAALEPCFPTWLRNFVGDEVLLPLRCNRLMRIENDGPSTLLALDVVQLTDGARSHRSPYFDDPADALEYLAAAQPDDVWIDVSTSDAAALNALRRLPDVRRVCVLAYCDAVLRAVAELPALEQLVLLVDEANDGSTPDADPAPLQKLTGLRELDIVFAATPTDAAAGDFFTSFAQLTALRLRRGRPGTVLPQFDWTAIGRLPLETLVLEAELLDDPAARAAVAALPKLRRLEWRVGEISPDVAAWRSRFQAAQPDRPGVEVALRFVDETRQTVPAQLATQRGD